MPVDYRRPESQCPHPDLDFRLNHFYLGDTNLHYLEIQGTCKICNEAIRFHGMDYGVSPNRPTMEPGGGEIRIPFLFEGDEGEIKGFPMGFTVARTQ